LKIFGVNVPRTLISLSSRESEPLTNKEEKATEEMISSAGPGIKMEMHMEFSSDSVITD
jgi:hypothetical protein